MAFDVSASKNYTTIPELASDWRVSISHLHNLVKQSKLPAFKVGHRYIIRREDAQRFLTENATAKAA